MDHLGQNALHHACGSGDVKTLERLVKSGMSIEQQDNEGYTPLMSAAFYGQPDAVEYMISQGNNIGQGLYIYSCLQKC